MVSSRESGVSPKVDNTLPYADGEEVESNHKSDQLISLRSVHLRVFF